MTFTHDEVTCPFCKGKGKMPFELYKEWIYVLEKHGEKWRILFNNPEG